MKTTLRLLSDSRKIAQKAPWLLRNGHDYLYGNVVVLSALRGAQRETFYKLHYSPTLMTPRYEQEILTLAKMMKIQLANEDKHFLNMAVSCRPHQGVVLEASPLVPPKVGYFGRVNKDETFNIIDDNGGISNSIPISDERVNPLVIALDSIQDPQNLGAILRSVYYFGADAVVICKKNSAPFSAVASRASSGAMELMTNLYVTSRMLDFMKESKRDGWKIYSLISPMSPNANASNFISLRDVNRQEIRKHPSILVVGNEGVGIRDGITNLADSFIGIPTYGTPPSELVESLNVAVAAGIILHNWSDILAKSNNLREKN